MIPDFKQDIETRDEYAKSSLPSRSSVHNKKKKKKKSKRKFKFLLIKLLVLFFILLPIAFYCVYAYLQN